jgi:hypothetical protein
MPTYYLKCEIKLKVYVVKFSRKSKCALMRRNAQNLTYNLTYLVPGEKVPFLEILILAPLYCWISTMERPDGPITAPMMFSFTSMSVLSSCSSTPGGGGGGPPPPLLMAEAAVPVLGPRPNELLLHSGPNWLAWAVWRTGAPRW